MGRPLEHPTSSFGVHHRRHCDRSIPGAGGHRALCTCWSPPGLEYPPHTLPGSVDSLLKTKSNVTTSGKQPVYPWAVFLWAPRFLSIPWCPSTSGCRLYFHLSFPQTEFLKGRDCLMCLRSAAGALWALLRASGSPLFACPGWARPRVHLSRGYCYHFAAQMRN